MQIKLYIWVDYPVDITNLGQSKKSELDLTGHLPET